MQANSRASARTHRLPKAMVIPARPPSAPVEGCICARLKSTSRCRPMRPHSQCRAKAKFLDSRYQSTALASLALPLVLSAPGMRASSPAIVVPSYFSVMLKRSFAMPSAAAFREASLFSLKPAE
jgi:hypothetical protein